MLTSFTAALAISNKLKLFQVGLSLLFISIAFFLIKFKLKFLNAGSRQNNVLPHLPPKRSRSLSTETVNMLPYLAKVTLYM